MYFEKLTWSGLPVRMLDRDLVSNTCAKFHDFRIF